MSLIWPTQSLTGVISNEVYWALVYPNTEFKHIFFLGWLLKYSSSCFDHLNLQQATLPEMSVCKLTSEILNCCWHLLKSFEKHSAWKHFRSKLSYELEHRRECCLFIHFYQCNSLRTEFLLLAYIHLSSLDYFSLDLGTLWVVMGILAWSHFTESS